MWHEHRHYAQTQRADLLTITLASEIVAVNYTIITFSQIKVTFLHHLTQTTRKQKQC